MNEINEFPKMKGEFAEDRIKNILDDLEKNGTIWKSGFFGRFTDEDLRRKDFIIYLQPGMSFYLQVKWHLGPHHKIRRLGLGIGYKRGVYYIESSAEETIAETKTKLSEIIKIVNQKRRRKKSYKENKKNKKNKRRRH